MNETPAVVTTLNQLRVADRAPLVQVGMTNSSGFELLQRAAKAMASSTLVPKEFQGNVANCIIAVEMASRIGASPLMVAQNLYIVHGRPGWSSKFLIASFNQCGRFSAIRYEWQGTPNTDEWGCRAWAIEKENGEKIRSPLITIALAKREGWYDKSGSKWKTIPELMLMYRSAGWMVNTHAPEISMGLNTAEELGEVFDSREVSPGAFETTIAEARHTSPAPSFDVEAYKARIEACTDSEVLHLELDGLRALDDNDLHKAEMVAVATRRLETLTSQ